MDIYIDIYTNIVISIYIYIYAAVSNGKRGWDQVIFLRPYIVCSSCIQKFVICPFVHKETNGSFPFEKGLNGLSHLGKQVLIL
jgi:hypothetical protein